MRAEGAIALIVIAGAVTSACGAIDPTDNAVPTVADTAPPTTAETTAPSTGPSTAPSTAPAASGPVRWTLVDTIDGVVAPGDTTAFVAANDAQWEAIWLGVGYPGERPMIDLGTDMVVVWTYGVSGSCDQDSLDDVVLEGTTIAPVFSSPYEPGTTCTADYNPRARIVAIDRASLPSVPFEVQSDRVACEGCSVSVSDVSDAAPAVVPLTPEDLAQIVVAAVELRAAAVEADPAMPIEIVDTLAMAAGSEPISLRGGTPLDETTRARLVERFAPREVRFVASTVVNEGRDGSAPFAVITVAAPSVVEGVLAIESSVWCGPTCYHSGAHELIVDQGRLWSVGEPVGPQTLA